MQRAPCPDLVDVVSAFLVQYFAFICFSSYQFPAKSFPPAKISIDSKVPRDGQTHGVGYNIE